MTSPPPLKIATWNVRALQTPGFTLWPDQPPLTKREYAAKTEFLLARIRDFDADILGLQEVAEEAAFEEFKAALADRYPYAVLGERGPGSGLRVAVLSRFPVTATACHTEIPPEGRIRLTEDSPVLNQSFRRPVLAVQLDVDGAPLTLVNVHLKAKRPDYFDAEVPADPATEDPVVRSRAMGRSLVVRAGEASGLRALMRQLQLQSKGAVVLLGDFNDGPDAVTTQILGKNPPPTGRTPRDEELYSTLAMQRRAGGTQGIHTHVWEGRAEVLDHIVVSGDLARRFRELRCVNDYLRAAPKDPTVSDHGALIAEFAPPKR